MNSARGRTRPDSEHATVPETYPGTRTAPFGAVWWVLVTLVRVLTQSQRSGLNRRPLDYESSALPLSYAGVPPTVVRHRSRRFGPLRGPSLSLIWSRKRAAFAPLPLRWIHALARTRTVTPCGTTPSRWRVYQFHHQGKPVSAPLHGCDAENRISNNGADGARTRDLSSDSRVL